MKNIAIIGSGIGGLATAVLLAKNGYYVTVYEKNEQLGGKAGFFREAGFGFDMGPSWYLMPDVFAQFFNELGEPIETHLNLNRLNPAYRVYFEGEPKPVDMPVTLAEQKKLFDQLEENGGAKIEKFLNRVKTQYELILSTYLRRDYKNVFDLFTPNFLSALNTIPLWGSVDQYISKTFTSTKAKQLLSYTLVFLGASPYNAPAFYAMMAHVDMTLGVYYPQGGITQIIQSLIKIGTKLGVRYVPNTPIKKIICQNGRATGLLFNDGKNKNFDLIVSNTDMYHTETNLLDSAYRSYKPTDWQSKTLAPSAILLYLGVKDPVPSLRHHTLYFTNDWQQHFTTVFDSPSWPEKPCYYIGCPSKTDPHVAPKGHENLFVLIPVASGLLNKKEANNYADRMIDYIGKTAKISNLRQRIVYKKIFGPADFELRYNTFKGTALGLAHTLNQTAFMRPRNKSKKVSNLYFVGADVHPGVGMPVCLISAELAVKRIIKEFPCS